MRNPGLGFYNVTYADLFNRARDLIFGLSLHLLPFYSYASNKGFGKHAQAHLCSDCLMMG